MLHPSTFFSPLPTPVPGLALKAVLFMGLLLVLFLSGCKSASTPTQTQMPAQPQSQSSESRAHDQAQQNTYPATRATIPARSDDEIIGDFDAELDASIAVFDGMILDERAKAEAIEASLGGGQEGGEQGGGSSAEGSLFEDGDIYEGLPGYGEFPESADQSGKDSSAQQASNEGEGSTASGDDSSGEAGAEGSVASPSGLETTRRGGIPEDIEGGSDDDIVARQIREAALQEKDPVLREKLWDEYRKYKNQQ